MWNSEFILSFVRKRLEASEPSGQGWSEQDMRMLQSARTGEIIAFSTLAFRLEAGDNPYQMLAKIRDVRISAPQEISGDDIANFQYEQACLEASGLVRNYLDEVEMSSSTPTSILPS